jgi:hypothetical protein
VINGQVSPTDLKKLEKIRETLDQRNLMYGKVLVRSLVGFSSRENLWKNGLTAFIALQPGEMRQNTRFEYQDVLFYERTVGTRELYEIVEKVIKNGKLSIHEGPEVDIQGSFSSNDYLTHLESGHKMFRTQWPSDFFQFEALDKGTNIPYGPFVRLNAPLYPNSMYLLQDRFNLNPSYYQQFLGGVIIFLPNYKARIKETRLGSKALSLSVENTTKERLVANLFLSDRTHTDTRTVKIEDSQAIIQLPFMPDLINLYLLSSETGETLDHRYHHLNYPTSSEEESLVIDIGEEDVEQLIARGESETVEFKQEIIKNKERFVEGIVALANTYGGTILIGVDDNGSIIGSIEQKLDEIIPSTIRSNCEPPIEVKIERKIIDDKAITVVRIPEGENKPYVHKAKGVLVRSGSTNRIASRYELEEFFKQNDGLPSHSSVSRRPVQKSRSPGQNWF